MRYFMALGTAMLGICFMGTAPQCAAQQGAQSNNGHIQLAAWQQDHDHDYDRDHDRDQDHDRDHDRDWDRSSVPQGAYISTCRDVHIEGDHLNATCEKRNGEWKRTSLGDFQRCHSEIVNVNGNLSCDK